MLADNLNRRESVLPLSRGRATGWAQDLGLPRGGKTVLYTGLMYQLMPSMIALERVLSRFEDSSLRHLFGAGRLANRVLNLSRLSSVLVSREDQEFFNGILRDIVRLLRAADVEFGYLYEEELYAGALAHDEGICGAFERQATRVHQLLQRNGVKRVITVDPHTTNILRSVYPRLFPGNGVEVRSYLEVLAEEASTAVHPLERSGVIHDSCVYARYEGVMEEPRHLLAGAGVEAREPQHSGKMTFCCGGPIESLFPGKARAIAEKRMEELAAADKRVVTMCPICLVNLRGAAKDSGLSVEDISRPLAESRGA